MPRDTTLLLQLTQLPTAAGKEQRVIDFIRQWAAARPVTLAESPSGNLHITMKARAANAAADPRPIYFTAHLDHPAFVVERIVAPGVLQLSFRGGVMDDYFKEARVAIFDSRDARHAARLTGKVDNTPGPFPHYLAELVADTDASSIALGDIAVWDLPHADIIDGILHTNACDDLAALAAALDAFDILLTRPATTPTADVRLLFTRAEEIGFIGAIAACREELMPKNSRVIALENSRSFADSPIGGGPIVRVGDRLSIFSPSLTDAIAKRAEELAGSAQPTASQKLSAAPAWKWQRKLMAGGACEASVFCSAGYEATCLCLPLGNYHNMADLEAVQAGKNTSPPVVGREYISIDDYFGLVDLLVACGERLPAISPMADRIEKLWNERKFVLTA